MRRLLAALSSCAVAAGLLVGVASPASAADLGTVTISYVGGVGYTIAPSTLSGGEGDTFSFFNGGTGSPKYLRNDTGSIRDGVTDCTVTDCPVNTNSTVSFTVVSPGVLSVVNSDGTTVIGTITISGSAPGPTDPFLVYPTMYLSANGGSCTGFMAFTKSHGQNGTVTLPTGTACTREGYTLSGWARSADATSSSFAAGSTVPIGDESFGLYAVWSPNGVEVTYDANVGANDQCLASGVTTDVRTSTSVVAVGSATSTSAPCAPPGMVLAGWALTGDGALTVQPGGVLPAVWTSGSSHRLYAKWKVTYGVTVSALPASVAPNSYSTVAVTASINSAPAANVAVALTASGAVAFGNGGTAVTVTTRADGTVTLPVYSRAAGIGTVTAAYGDRASSVTIDVSNPVTKSITVTGERVTVSGKPGIQIEGVTTGFAAGERVVPYFRFPGQTEYTAGSARPEINADGEFVWQRKTGKKFYAYFTSDDGLVTSNRVIVPAN